MKHNLHITSLLIGMFVIAQLFGIFVASRYAPVTVEQFNQTTGLYENKTLYNLPYGMGPPEDIQPASSVLSIVLALIMAVLVMFLLMRLRAETFLRAWFFLVVVLGTSLALNAFFMGIAYASIIALIVAAPLAYFKIIKRNMYAHNITEMLIYPGIASVFIPILSIPAIIILLVIISIYDMYAVWHAGFMQKMAKYQIENLKIFSGFFVPYVGKSARIAIQKAKTANKNNKKVHVNIALLGGGDIVFPIITAGVVLPIWGLVPALLVSLGATCGLTYLFYISEKGKFYPAMPFITVGCFIGLLVGYLIH